MLSTLPADEAPNQTIPVPNKNILLVLQADKAPNQHLLIVQLETPTLF